MTKEELNLYLEGLIAKQATQSYRDTFAIGQGALPAVSAPQLPQFAESPLAQQQMAGALKDKPRDLTENFGKSYDRLTSGLTAAGTIASTMIDGLNLGTYNTDQQSQMRQVNSIDPSQAYQAMSTLTAAKTFDKTDFGGADTGGMLKNIGIAAAAGSTFGPIGAIVAGLGAAGTTLLGNHKAKKDANIATAKSQMAYNDGVNSINNGLTNYNYDKMIHNRTNILAEGGPITTVDEGGSHAESQFGGVPMGFDAAGNQNLVEQGESVDKEKQYVFSDQLKMPKSFIDKYKLKAGTFSDGIKEFTDRGYKDIEGDNIARKTYQAFRDDLMNTQETEKIKKAARIAKKMGLQAPPIDEYGMPIEQPHVMANGDFLRGLQPLGDVIGLAYNAFDTYRPAEVQTAQHAREISATPITTTLQTTPLDNVFEMRQAQNMTNQVINNLNNSNSSGRTASILAAQVNGLNQQGNAYRQAVNFENQRRTNEATFNRGTQQMNSQMGLQAAMANAQHDDAYRHMLGQQSQFNVSTKDQWKRGNDAAIGQELSNIFNSFGNMGREKHDLGLIKALADSGVFGTVNDIMAVASKIR